MINTPSNTVISGAGIWTRGATIIGASKVKDNGPLMWSLVGTDLMWNRLGTTLMWQ